MCLPLPHSPMPMPRPHLRRIALPPTTQLFFELGLARINICSQDWLLCHLRVYSLDFEFEFELAEWACISSSSSSVNFECVRSQAHFSRPNSSQLEVSRGCAWGQKNEVPERRSCEGTPEANKITYLGALPSSALLDRRDEASVGVVKIVILDAQCAARPRLLARLHV